MKIIFNAAIFAIYSGLLCIIAYKASHALSKDTLISIWLASCGFSYLLSFASLSDNKQGGSRGAGR